MIWGYPYFWKPPYIHLPAFHLSIFPTHSKNQGTKTLVPLEPNVLFADLKDSLRRHPRGLLFLWMNLKLGGTPIFSGRPPVAVCFTIFDLNEGHVRMISSQKRHLVAMSLAKVEINWPGLCLGSTFQTSKSGKYPIISESLWLPQL